MIAVAKIIRFLGKYQGIGVLVLSICLVSSGKRSGHITTVVIDAGHGGYDPGCEYKGRQEKDVTLAICLKLGRLIDENVSGTKVIYTRKTDKFVELHERAAIANRNHADVFISIHVNSNKVKTVTGTETYTMGTHKNEDNLSVAKRENDVVLLESDYTAQYDGFDPKAPEAHIIFSMYQSAHLQQSLRLASKIENSLKSKLKRKTRGVKQAGFLVLWKTTMPSILIETGFLSNNTERAYLCSEEGQNELARGIYSAFAEYKNEMDHSKK